MDETPHRFAYRCLPLSVANAHGWQLLTDEPFSAYWDGGVAKECVHIVGKDGGPAPYGVHAHFGSGMLTFGVPGIFRTSPKWWLFVTGPVNQPKAGIHPLTAVVKTDEGGHTFTMNWKFLDPHRLIRFERDEPFCHIFPIPAGMLDGIRPEFHDVRDDPSTAEDYRRFQQATRRGDGPTARPSCTARPASRSRSSSWTGRGVR
jgi:hypothetical protein